MTSQRLPAASTAALVAAATVGIASGAATAYLQGVVSADWNAIANSGAVWTIVAFVVVAASTRTPASAAAAGLLAMVGEVGGYYVYLADVRHLAAGRFAELLWTMAALWIGPLTGVTAFRARWGDSGQRAVAWIALAGVVAGEGGYLVRIAGVPTAGWVEIASAGALAAGSLAFTSAPLRSRAAALAAGVGVAAAVYTAYRLLAFS